MHVSLTAEALFHLGPLTITNSLLTTWIVIAATALFAVLFKLTLKKHPKGIQNIVEAVIDGFHGIVEGVAENKKLARKFFAPIFTIFLFVLLNNWAGLIPGVGSVGITHAEAAGEHAPTHVEETHTVESDLLKSSIAEADDHEATVLSESTESITDDHGTESATTTDSHAPVQENESRNNELQPEAGLPLAETKNDHSKTTEAHGEETTHGEESHSTFTPIFRPGSADLSFTLALAVCAVAMVQFVGVRKFGIWGYFKRFINFKNPVLFFVGLLEIVSEFSKMISFSFRLFGNVFAGEVLLTVIIALAPIIAPMPFYALEIFVGLVQALVFAMLTLVFFRMSTSEAH